MAQAGLWAAQAEPRQMAQLLPPKRAARPCMHTQTGQGSMARCAVEMGSTHLGHHCFRDCLDVCAWLRGGCCLGRALLGCWRRHLGRRCRRRPRRRRGACRASRCCYCRCAAGICWCRCDGGADLLCILLEIRGVVLVNHHLCLQVHIHRLAAHGPACMHPCPHQPGIRLSQNRRSAAFPMGAVHKRAQPGQARAHSPVAQSWEHACCQLAAETRHAVAIRTLGRPPAQQAPAQC